MQYSAVVSHIVYGHEWNTCVCACCVWREKEILINIFRFSLWLCFHSLLFCQFRVKTKLLTSGGVNGNIYYYFRWELMDGFVTFHPDSWWSAIKSSLVKTVSYSLLLQTNALLSMARWKQQRMQWYVFNSCCSTSTVSISAPNEEHNENCNHNRIAQRRLRIAPICTVCVCLTKAKNDFI